MRYLSSVSKTGIVFGTFNSVKHSNSIFTEIFDVEISSRLIKLFSWNRNGFQENFKGNPKTSDDALTEKKD